MVGLFCCHAMAAAVQVIQSAETAEKLLKPERLRILEMLAEPDSASGLARRLEMPRQTVNYHLRELEKERLVEFVEQRQRGNCLERVVRARARAYLISPAALGTLGLAPDARGDQFSAAYLVSAAARTIRDITVLRERADAAGKSLATLTIETSIRFASAERRREFTEELLAAIAGLAAKYHDETSPGGRRFRLMAGAHPSSSAAPARDQFSGGDSVLFR